MSGNAQSADRAIWRSVESSNVDAIGWIPGYRGMLVRFKNGSLYLYKDVSRQRAVATSRAESVGGYINRAIKPNFEVVRIER